ncbi:MAG TPA: hypothetical protein VGT04_06535, partial [Acidobacteriaceae bacterium]|nr:hypothetical protein [Acidobacteriaceae bacterium]
YQHGQGVKQDNGEALSWYQLSANEGDLDGQRNLGAFTSDLKYQRGAELANAINEKFDDPAYAQVRRSYDIRDLQAQITGLESDAVEQDDLADQLEHMNKGKNDFVGKAFKAIGSAGAAPHRADAAKYRAEAARLRAQVAQLQSQNAPPI